VPSRRQNAAVLAENVPTSVVQVNGRRPGPTPIFNGRGGAAFSSFPLQTCDN
jgi:hypothetical protein